MEASNTAYNKYVLCSDCEHGKDCYVDPDTEFDCMYYGSKVKNVGICKFYKRCIDGNDQD
jgi:hypothetical protein